MRLGSRGSPLARWQAESVQRQLAALGHPCRIEYIQTTGDRTAGSLAAIGGKGLFTQELEEGLLAGRLDLAVHSLKDLPTRLPPGLVLAAVLEREDPRDALVAAPGITLAGLPRGARVGTASLRRQAQALALRPDLRILPLRGNVETRLRKWRDGDCDAVLLAAAGLKRLGLDADIAEWLDPARFCPAAGQGALAIETRADDAATLAALRGLHHQPTWLAVTAERALLARLECGCQAPVAAYARPDAGALRLDAVVASPDGARLLRRHAATTTTAAGQAAAGQAAAAALGRELAEALLAAGAGALLEPARG